MSTSRIITVPLFTAALFACLFYAIPRALAGGQSPQAAAASSELQKGISLYRQGKDKEAVKVLRVVVKQDRTNADAWHHLGLAHTRQGDVKDARKAFEATIKLRPNFAAARTGLAYTFFLSGKSNDARREAERALELNDQSAEAHYIIGASLLREDEPTAALPPAEKALQIKPDFAPAYLLKSQALLAADGKDIARSSKLLNSAPERRTPEFLAMRRAATRQRFTEAAENLARFLELTPDTADKQFWREQLETLRVYAKPVDATAAESPDSESSSSGQKAVILKRPAPGYTVQARRTGIEGTVTLRLVLASDGTVKHILVMRALSHGLTEKAVAAARKIQFTPAMKNGRPASQFVVINYSFGIY